MSLRPNLYAGFYFEKPEVNYLVVASAVGVVVGLCVLFTIGVVLYCCFCVESTRPAEPRERRGDSHAEDDTDSETARREPNRWKRFFDRMLSTEKVGGSAAVHALLYMPADMRLTDARENAELADDKVRMRRAQQRRAALEELLYPHRTKTT